MRPILDIVAISLGVEGVVCEEQEGRVNVYIALYCILLGPKVSLSRFLAPRGIENNQALFRTPAAAHMPIVDLSSSS
jgi:hypothetical protein